MAKPNGNNIKKPSGKRPPRPLNLQQIQFCNEYIIDFHATNAAKRAGYSERTAYSMGSALLKKPEIQEKIREIKEDVFRSVGVTQAKTFRELARIAFFDIGEIYDGNGKMLPLNELTQDQRAAITAVKVYHETVGRGKNKKTIGQMVEVKLADKKGALEAIIKTAGWSKPDKLALTDPEGNSVTIFQIPDNGRDRNHQASGRVSDENAQQPG